MKDASLIITRAPHAVGTLNTAAIMRAVLVAMLPELAAACVHLGRAAFFRVVFSVFICVAFEWMTRRILGRKQTVKDLSAAVTGMIFAFLVPADVPYRVIILGAFVAIVIVKQLFGGLGQNFINPAATAWAAMLISFPAEMTVERTPIELYINAMPLPSDLKVFLGPVEGCIGGISAAAILLGGIYLLVKRIIEPTIPLCYIASAAFVSVLWGLDPLFHVLAGGLLFGAFFMATDPVTTPALRGGKVIFGILAGFLTMVMRIYCTFPSSVPFAVMFMNIFTPHIDRFMRYFLLKRGDKDETA